MEEKLSKKSEAQRFRDNEEMCFAALVTYMKLLQEWNRLYAPGKPGDTPDNRFVQACQQLDYVEYLVNLLIMGGSYERNEVIDMMLTDGKLTKLQAYLKKAMKEDEKANEQRKDSSPAL